jgi:hypothetical protein
MVVNLDAYSFMIKQIDSVFTMALDSFMAKINFAALV